MVDDFIPLMCSPPSTFSERMMDLMLIETFLIDQRHDIEGGTSTSPCAANRHSSSEEVHTQVLLRSEAEQLVGQELIKALSDFKQWMATPSSSQTQQPKPLVKVSDVERPVDT
jgi:hypothetical protein